PVKQKHVLRKPQCSILLDYGKRMLKRHIVRLKYHLNFIEIIFIESIKTRSREERERYLKLFNTSISQIKIWHNRMGMIRGGKPIVPVPFVPNDTDVSTSIRKV